MRHIATRLIVALVAVGAALAGDVVELSTSRLRLRHEAVVQRSAAEASGPARPEASGGVQDLPAGGATVTLGDVLSLAEADPRLAERIAREPLVSDLPAPARLKVTHEQIRQRLSELNVNMARVLIVGAMECDVRVEAPAAGTDATASEPSGLMHEAAEPGGESTLAAALRAQIAEELSNLGGQPEVQFDVGSMDVLNLTSPPWEFVIRSADREKLGTREFTVVIRRDSKHSRTVRIAARVRLVRPVVVAVRPLNLGAYIKPEDVAFEQRVFEAGDELGVDTMDALLGHQVRSFVAAGQMVRAADVKPVDMVTRSQRVTVVNDGRGVNLRLAGVALENGTYGETVRVRIGESRTDRRVVRGLVTSFGTVRLMEEWQ